MIVTFCGHRNITEREAVKGKLSAEIFRLFVDAQHSDISLSFYCGGYGEFDRLSEQIIEEVRRDFPTVSCEKLFITPYITPTYKERNDIMKERFDGILYPPIENVPYRFAIIRRNEWMVDKADLVIAYVITAWGGAMRTLEYAKRKRTTCADMIKSRSYDLLLMGSHCRNIVGAIYPVFIGFNSLLLNNISCLPL